jgi:hypothetical protein
MPAGGAAKAAPAPRIRKGAVSSQSRDPMKTAMIERRAVRESGSSQSTRHRAAWEDGGQRRTPGLTRASTRGQTTTRSPGLDHADVNHRPTPTWPNGAFIHPFGVPGRLVEDRRSGVSLRSSPRQISVTPLGVDERDCVATAFDERSMIGFTGALFEDPPPLGRQHKWRDAKRDPFPSACRLTKTAVIKLGNDTPGSPGIQGFPTTAPQASPIRMRFL